MKQSVIYYHEPIMNFLNHPNFNRCVLTVMTVNI